MFTTGSNNHPKKMKVRRITTTLKYYITSVMSPIQLNVHNAIIVYVKMTRYDVYHSFSPNRTEMINEY